MTVSNPWFWAPHTNRWAFEQELAKTAVLLRDKGARVVVNKVSIEDVKARKNALAAKGVLSNASAYPSLSVVPRKIK